MVKVINAQQTVYTDQTGWFPVQSSWGNRLLMLIYDVDGNYIDVEPMKDNKDNLMIKAYEALWGRITKLRENKPNMHILTTKPLRLSKQLSNKIATYNWFHPTPIVVTLQKEQSKHSNHILLQLWRGLIQAFPCTYGIDSCHKQCLHSISSDERKTIQPYRHTSMSTEHLITIKCHLRR